jgi:hypothetical protein
VVGDRFGYLVPAVELLVPDLVVEGFQAGATANAQTTEPARQAAEWHGREFAAVAANKRVVEAFMADVLNGHHGDHAARYFTEGMSWHGGTVGTVSGRDNVAGLMTLVVTSIPDLRASVQDIFGQGDEVVRLVVTGYPAG